MLGVSGGRAPNATWPVPPGLPDALQDAWSALGERCVAAAGGDPTRVTRDAFLAAVNEAIPGLSQEAVDYVRRVSLAVLQQARGSCVFFADLEYLRAALLQGRVPPAECDPPRSTLSASLFATQTSQGTKTLDLFKSTGVTWKIPRGFLSRYNAASHQVLRQAAALAGATRGSVDVVAGAWGRVDVPTFLEACRQVLGALSTDEEEYVAALAAEQVPAGSPHIRDLPYLDKCLQQGRTPTSIKGPELLPTIFLNNTTSGEADGMALRHTGGRTF